eukprot:6610608-Ditylum_brightwellii.AAC.1
MKSTDPKLHLSAKGSKSKWTIADIPSGTKIKVKLTVTFPMSAWGSGRATLKCNLHATEEMS